jgi:hypothetical protein
MCGGEWYDATEVIGDPKDVLRFVDDSELKILEGIRCSSSTLAMRGVSSLVSLSSLERTRGLFVADSPDLVSVDGLDQLISTAGLGFESNANLADLSALSSLVEAGTITLGGAVNVAHEGTHPDYGNDSLVAISVACPSSLPLSLMPSCAADCSGTVSFELHARDVGTSDSSRFLASREACARRAVLGA